MKIVLQYEEYDSTRVICGSGEKKCIITIRHEEWGWDILVADAERVQCLVVETVESVSWKHSDKVGDDLDSTFADEEDSDLNKVERNIIKDIWGNDIELNVKVAKRTVDMFLGGPVEEHNYGDTRIPRVDSDDKGKER